MPLLKIFDLIWLWVYIHNRQHYKGRIAKILRLIINICLDKIVRAHWATAKELAED